MSKFEVEELPLAGVKIITPKVFNDERGYFMETFSGAEFRRRVADVDFVQDNESCSSRGVVRGLHFQKPPFAQGKLVRCTRGCVLDVAVDLRKSSPTFGRYVAVELSDTNHRQLYIPEGFAHGFSVLSERAVFEYKCTNYYHPESEGGVSLFSPALDIDWGVDLSEAIISPKDRIHQDFSLFDSPFD